MQDHTGRFSTRPDHYVKARPGYPAAMLAVLREDGMLRDGASVADIGSGTGLLAELFLRAGYDVMAVEPNAEMRQAGERQLGNLPNFLGIQGRAEWTTLPDASVDLVTVGTAFHWFDRDAAAKEFRRILRSDGHVMVAWNQRIRARPSCATMSSWLNGTPSTYWHPLSKQSDLLKNGIT